MPREIAGEQRQRHTHADANAGKLGLGYSLLDITTPRVPVQTARGPSFELR